MGNDSLEKLNKLVNKADKILLVSSTRPTIDSISSVFLMWHYLSLNFDKDISIYIPSIQERYDFLFNYSMLEKENIIKDILREYTLSIKKQDGVIDKVRYDTEDNLFNFHISLKSGALDTNSFNLDKSQFNYDLVFTIDVEKINFVGDLYKIYKDDFESRIKIINIDSHATNLRFGDLNILSNEVSSTSEIILDIINSTRTLLSHKECQLILMSILSNTENLSIANISQKTFENISFLTKNGGIMNKALVEVSSPNSLIDLKAKAHILENVEEYVYKKEKYIYSIIENTQMYPSYLTDIYIKDAVLTCIVIKGDVYNKFYIKDFKDIIKIENLSKFFDDVKSEDGVLFFKSKESNIKNILEKIAILKN